MSDLFLHITEKFTVFGNRIMRRIFVLLRKDVTENCGKYKNIILLITIKTVIYIVTKYLAVLLKIAYKSFSVGILSLQKLQHVHSIYS